MESTLKILILSIIAGFVIACSGDAPPMNRLEDDRDSVAVMTTHGVSKLVNDSGRVKYRIIAEEWRVYDKTSPPRQEFPKGLFLERFDRNFKMNMYITADSAWCYDQYLWKLLGHVVIIDKETATSFRTEELFWNMREHRFYSSRHMHVVKPDRELQGDRFTANEQLTKYHVWQSKGYMPMPDDGNNSSSIPSTPSSPPGSTLNEPSDTAKTS